MPNEFENIIKEIRREKKIRNIKIKEGAYVYKLQFSLVWKLTTVFQLPRTFGSILDIFFFQIIIIIRPSFLGCYIVGAEAQELYYDYILS